MTFFTNNLYKKFLFLILFVVVLFQQSHAELSYTSHDIGKYVQLITDDIDKTRKKTNQEDKNLQVIMKRLCTNVMNDELSKVTLITSERTTYNAKESVFVTIVCNSILSNKADKTVKDDSFLMNDLLKQHNIWSL